MKSLNQIWLWNRKDGKARRITKETCDERREVINHAKTIANEMELVLKMAMSELIHLGAEDPDEALGIEKRESPACDAIRAVLKKVKP
jgi:hypothetical protein